jgi:hypothetical protein
LEFVQNYRKIAAPLTGLLKRNSFTWNLVVDHSFQSLKDVVFSIPVLALLDLTNNFVLECDASRKGIGAILMKDGRPLAFTSIQLSERHLGRSIYEKEMLSILHVVHLWCPYLFGQSFQIKTDH